VIRAQTGSGLYLQPGLNKRTKTGKMCSSPDAALRGNLRRTLCAKRL